MKTLGADYNAADGVIRIHTPEKLKGQEEFKAERAETLKTKLALEESVEPILAQMFKLYYIEPTQAKSTLEDLFGLGDAGGEGEGASSGGVSSNLSITVESTTRSIIVRGKEKDLDVVDKVIKEIDIRTKQVLIEAFIVEANSDFERALGTRLGGYYQKQGSVAGGLAGTSTGSAVGFDPGTAAGLGSATDTLSNFPVTGATSGIGLLRRTTAGVLKAEITALESLGMGKTISNPKVFTLDNQLATVTQGEEIPYQTTSEGTTSTSFKEAALKLQVTPSIIGDGNVLLDIQVNNDDAVSYTHLTLPTKA